MSIHLTPSNFFRYYIFHPKDKTLQETDRKVARRASILFALFTLGIGPLVCLLFYKKNITHGDKKNSAKKPADLGQDILKKPLEETSKTAPPLPISPPPEQAPKTAPPLPGALPLDTKASTPLHRAIIKGDVEKIIPLIEKEALVKQDSNGDTPLQLAISLGHFKVVKLLTEGALEIKNKQDFTPLQRAVWKGIKEIVEFLISQGADIKAQGQDGCVALHIAVQKNNLEIVKYLLEKDPSQLDVINSDGSTPLIFAARGGYLDIVAHLLNLKANLEIKTKEGATALLLAADQNKFDVVKLLVAKGASLNQSIDVGTVMHLAVSNDNPEMVEFLLKKNATRIDDRNSAGFTPLCLAIAYGSLSLVQLLLSHGASVDKHFIKDNSFISLIELAEKWGHPEIANLLFEKASESTRSLKHHRELTFHFELDVQLSFESKEYSIGGFDKTTYDILCDIKDSVSHCENWTKALTSWTEEDTQIIIDTLDSTIKLADQSINRESRIQLAQKRYQESKPLLISTITKQAVSICFYKDLLLMGDYANLSGIEFYNTKNLKNIDDIIANLITDQDSSPDYASICDLKTLCSKIIRSKKEQYQGPIPPWMSAKLGVEEIFMAYLYSKNAGKKEEAKDETIKIYKAWVEEDRLQTLKNYIKNVPERDSHKAYILGCIHHHLSLKGTKFNKDLMQMIALDCPEAVAYSSNRIERKEGSHIYRKKNL